MAIKNKITIKRGSRYKKYFHGIDLIDPSEEDCVKYNQLWDEYNAKGKFSREKVLDKAFLKKHKSHKDPFGMYVKCVLLDKFYSTNVKHIDKLVEHYIELETTRSTRGKSYFKQQIKSKNIKFVDELKVVKVNEDDVKNLLSFSSKYCRRYAPLDFPIYDTIVRDLLKYYLYKTNFWGGEPPKDWEDNYEQYKQVVDKFIETYPFVKNYMIFDRYLWALGKQKETGINMIKDVRSGGENEIENVKKKLGIEKDKKISIDDLEGIIVTKYELV